MCVVNWCGGCACGRFNMLKHITVLQHTYVLYVSGMTGLAAP